MFFREEQLHFFKPLSGKYREVVVGCLKAFHDRVYGQNADYGHHIDRDELRDTFVNVIQTTPVLDEEQGAEDMDMADERKFANELIRLLCRFGWIEEFTDKASLVRAFRFTRSGKSFASVFINLDAPKLRTRQRNVRSAKNSLESFLRTNDPYDLVDAITYSNQISDDFNEDIAYLYDARRALMREAAENRAIDFFIDYVERVFSKDIKIRFSADSVERHRARIDEIISEIRGLSEEQLQRANSSLSTLLPDDFGPRGGSPVDRALSAIENIISASCDSKVQELRNALTGFVARAKMLQHQAAVLAGGFGGDQLPAAMAAIAEASDERQDAILARVAAQMGLVNVSLIDPGQLRMRRKIDLRKATTVTTIPQKTREDLLKAHIQASAHTAFEYSPQKIKASLLEALESTDQLLISQLPAASAEDVLAMLNAAPAAAIMESRKDKPLEIKRTGKQVSTPFATFEELIIRKPI